MKQRQMTKSIACLFVCCCAIPTGTAFGVDVSGEVKTANATYGAGVDYRLVGDASFGWQREPFTGNLDINGHKFVMETGGGNRTVFSAVISGEGVFDWNGGGNAAWQTTPSFLTGEKPNTFTGVLTILRDLAKAAKSNGTLLVLATLSVYREKPDGSNPKDAICDQYAEITRKVATSTGSTLVDLRKVFLAYLQNHNAELRIDGSLNFLETGVLTYDGVHPNATGNRLLANHLSQGIYEAMGKTAHR